MRMRGRSWRNGWVGIRRISRKKYKLRGSEKGADIVRAFFVFELVEGVEGAFDVVIVDRLCALCCGAVEFGDFVAVGDEDDAGAIDEEAVFDDARDVAEFA